MLYNMLYTMHMCYIMGIKNGVVCKKMLYNLKLLYNVLITGYIAFVVVYNTLYTKLYTLLYNGLTPSW